MELKSGHWEEVPFSDNAFNRTAYGIEIAIYSTISKTMFLLIAPLMELKWTPQMFWVSK